MFNNNRQQFNTDAQANIFWERQLEYIKSPPKHIIYADLKANELIPAGPTVPRGTEFYIYQQYDSIATAKIISNYADDLPIVNLSAKEYKSRLKPIGNSYLISIQDIYAGNMGNVDIEQQLLTTAIKSQQQKLNQLAFFGDDIYGLTGLLTNPNVDNQLVAGSTTAEKKWANKATTNPLLILKDLNDAVTFIVNTTKGVEVPNSLVLPVEQYQYLATTLLSTNTGVSLLEQFTRTYPYIKVIWSAELEGAFAGNTDGFILYNNSPDKLYQVGSYLYDIMPPLRQNLAYLVQVHSKYGGVIIEYPQSMVFRRGI